jgi:enoyl-CoA hydratase
MVYASDTAQFGQPEVKLGLMPGFGGTQRLARRVGPMRATELVSTGRMVPADEAKTIGLCLDVFPQAELMERVMKIAKTIGKRGPAAVRASKKIQRLGVQAPLAVANAYEAEAFGVLFDTADAREGMTAFLEKRGADFKNR